MSNFLRNLFGDKHKAAEAKEVGNIPKAPPSSSSSPSLSTTTAPIVIPTIADDESMT